MQREEKSLYTEREEKRETVYTDRKKETGTVCLYAGRLWNYDNIDCFWRKGNVTFGTQ